jgi:hypothetical protein
LKKKIKQTLADITECEKGIVVPYQDISTIEVSMKLVKDHTGESIKSRVSLVEKESLLLNEIEDKTLKRQTVFQIII